MKAAPATISHFIGGCMQPIDRRSKMAGSVCTIRMQGKDSACLYYAMKHTPKGSVLVIDRLWSADVLGTITGLKTFDCPPSHMAKGYGRSRPYPFVCFHSG